MEENGINYNRIGIGDDVYLQTSYAIEEEEEEDEDKNDDSNDKDKDKDDYSNNNKKDNSIFNIASVGDWDCTGDTEDRII